MTMQADPRQSATESPTGSAPPASPSQPSRKRKATSAGSRGVATLTPDQLAKKRANDREAQRAIRERTKQTIENLERRIEDLTAQQPYQELQAIIREKDAIQAENVEIRRRLSSIVALIQPILGAQGLTGIFIRPSYPQPFLTCPDLASAAHQNAQNNTLQSANVFQTDAYVNGQQRSFAQPLTQTESGYGPFQEAAPASQPLTASKGALEQQRDNLKRGLELNDNGERLSFNFLFDNLNNTQRIPEMSQINKQYAPPSGRYSFSSSPTDDQRPWNTLPKLTDPTCPLDHILLNLYQKARRDSSAHSEASGPSSQQPPAMPSVMSLLNPSHLSSMPNIDTLSQTMADVTTRFPHINTIPNRVAVVYTMFVTARWFMYPTQENYERMPEWMQPRSTQLLLPHPAWMDYLPWPLLRDKVILNHKDYPFENWFIPFTTGFTVNWPYGPMDCLLSTSENDDPVINPVFEKHIRKLENWSVTSLFIETFPALHGTVRVLDPDPGTRADVPHMR